MYGMVLLSYVEWLEYMVTVVYFVGFFSLLDLIN